jgi:hypothetical protein
MRGISILAEKILAFEDSATRSLELLLLLIEI